MRGRRAAAVNYESATQAVDHRRRVSPGSLQGGGRRKNAPLGGRTGGAAWKLPPVPKNQRPPLISQKSKMFDKLEGAEIFRSLLPILFVPRNEPDDRRWSITRGAGSWVTAVHVAPSQSRLRHASSPRGRAKLGAGAFCFGAVELGMCCKKRTWSTGAASALRMDVIFLQTIEP